MKTAWTTLLISSMLAVSVGQARSASELAPATNKAMASIMTEAEVRKVDKDAAKITLRHGEIKHLEMPAMTMVFQVKDKAMLDRVKAGDKVRFAAHRAGGVYTITRIELAQ